MVEPLEHGQPQTLHGGQSFPQPVPTLEGPGWGVWPDEGVGSDRYPGAGTPITVAGRLVELDRLAMGGQDGAEALGERARSL